MRPAESSAPVVDTPAFPEFKATNLYPQNDSKTVQSYLESLQNWFRFDWFAWAFRSSSINGRRVRRTKQVVEIVGVDPHSQEVITNEVFKWDPARDDFDFSGKSYVLEKIMVKINYTQEKMRQELRTRKRILDWMVLNDIRKSDQVAQIITEYYVRPNDVLARVDGLRWIYNDDEW